MTSEAIKDLPIDQKIQILEAIWEDFRDRFERTGLSQSQKDLLDHRKERVERGDAKLLDLDLVKSSIGRS